MKYLPLFLHFKAIYLFPKHIIFLVKIVAIAPLILLFDFLSYSSSFVRLFSEKLKLISGVMVSVIASSMLGRSRFKPSFGFSAKYATIRIKTNDWLAQN